MAFDHDTTCMHMRPMIPGFICHFYPFPELISPARKSEAKGATTGVVWHLADLWIKTAKRSFFIKHFTQWTKVRAVECDKRFQAQLLESWRRSQPGKMWRSTVRFVMTLQLETCRIYVMSHFGNFLQNSLSICFLQQPLKHWIEVKMILDWTKGPMSSFVYLSLQVARTNNTEEASERVHRRQVCQSWPPICRFWIDIFSQIAGMSLSGLNGFNS